MYLYFPLQSPDVSIVLKQTNKSQFVSKKKQNKSEKLPSNCEPSKYTHTLRKTVSMNTIRNRQVQSSKNKNLKGSIIKRADSVKENPINENEMKSTEDTRTKYTEDHCTRMETNSELFGITKVKANDLLEEYYQPIY